MDAARIAQRNIPAMKAGYIFFIVSEKTVSALTESSVIPNFFKYTVPRVPIKIAPMYEIIIQMIPMRRAFPTSEFERIPMKRTMMCGIPK